jgi:putative phosphoesterase
MKVLVLSDTHLSGEIPRVLVEVLKDADLILHAGDFSSEGVYRSIAQLGRLEAVKGNSDSAALKALLPERLTMEAEGIRIGMVHEAALRENSVGPVMLAREMEVQVLIYGHLHKPVLNKTGGRLLLCPGSPTRPRMSSPTVASLEIEKGAVEVKVVTLGPPTCDYLRYANLLAEENAFKEQK